jgi:aspartyl-tRNA(Asn)/glutamyl-tRNA(Gln) amidotransferase subunit C
MSQITPDDVRYVARLARIDLTDTEVSRLQGDLSQILTYIEQLQAVPTDQVEPTSHILPLKNVLREDVVRPCLSADAVVQHAPVRQGAYVKVPKVVEAAG